MSMAGRGAKTKVLLGPKRKGQERNKGGAAVSKGTGQASGSGSCEQEWIGGGNWSLLPGTKKQ